MGNSKIIWLQNPDGTPGKTWPLAEGCTKMSAGCLNCCAESTYHRWHKNGDFREVRLKTEHLEDPLHWKKPQRVLVDFMFDLFHPAISRIFIADVFAIMSIARAHTFMILTKRAERMKKLMDMPRFTQSVELHMERICGEHGWCPPDLEWPLPHVWLGVSVEDQATADERIPLPAFAAAAVRFVSYEPALKSIDFGNYLCQTWRHGLTIGTYLDWLIMGCESGPGARPMDIEWAQSVKDQCVAAGVPFFFKQRMIGRDLIHMPLLDGKFWNAFPEVGK